MLSVLFTLDQQRYAVSCRRIVEVVPRVELRAVPRAPEYVAGLLDYRGVIVPVIDLRCLVTGSACRALYSTRIILTEYSGTKSVAAVQETHILGIMAEQVTEITDISGAGMRDPGLHTADASYLGKISVDAEDTSMLQLIEIEQLLPAEVRHLLFTEPEVTG